MGEEGGGTSKIFIPETLLRGLFSNQYLIIWGIVVNFVKHAHLTAASVRRCLILPGETTSFTM